MSRIFIALTAAAFVTVAVPASAMSITFTLPNLTYPPVTTPDVTQGCSTVTHLSSETCETTSK